MNVKELKLMLADCPDEMNVLISLTGEFDGAFVHPCLEESGEADLGIYEIEEDEKEAALLNRPITEKSFVLVRCGFFNEHDGVEPELN